MASRGLFFKNLSIVTTCEIVSKLTNCITLNNEGVYATINMLLLIAKNSTKNCCKKEDLALTNCILTPYILNMRISKFLYIQSNRNCTPS